jgi:fermentation-respiration switch protein FrsA (DUF1100 family)
MNADVSVLDRPDVLAVLFHPRRDDGAPLDRPSRTAGTPRVQDILVPVAAEIAVGARFHLGGPAYANILFFHGNGEIAADYDAIGPFYNRIGANFLAADYRGYGRSGGQPTVTTMMQDCHDVFKFVGAWLEDNGFGGPVIVMGRSLGSASAIELAAAYPGLISGLIVESGFACAGPLLRLLGVDPDRIGFREEAGFQHSEKIGRIRQPVLIIHAEFDHIIPFSEGQALYDACPSPAKTLITIPGANHNDILVHAFDDYLSSIRKFIHEA